MLKRNGETNQVHPGAECWRQQEVRRGSEGLWREEQGILGAGLGLLTGVGCPVLTTAVGQLAALGQPTQ